MAPTRPTLALTTGLVAAALALGACSTTSGGTPVTLSTTTTAGADAGPTTTTTSEPDASLGKELFVYAPVEGDCIDLRATTDRGATTTRVVPDPNGTPHGSNELVLRLECALPHQYEVIAVVDAGLAGQPDEAALVTAAKQLCPRAFATYVATPYESSALEVGWVLPGQSQRSRGSQQVGCLAFDPAGKLSGSVRGSGR